MNIIEKLILAQYDVINKYRNDLNYEDKIMKTTEVLRIILFEGFEYDIVMKVVSNHENFCLN